ncbi:MAG: penicillin-binding protein 2 [Deltaproteobacteria bacterium]|nr:MAG: penicillin-binding protein 2 [Deltaproteobacteria bacterium]
MPIDFSDSKSGERSKRISFAFALVFFFFLTVICRLFYLQIIKGNFYRNFSSIHTMKEIKIPAGRGIIFDRNHVAIAENRPSFDLVIIPQHVKNLEAIKNALGKIVNISSETIDSKWKEGMRQPKFYPITLVSDISYDTAVKIRGLKVSQADDENENLDLRGVEVVVRPLRSYPQGPIATNTLGYIAEISEKELLKRQKTDPGRYSLGDLVGAAGIEKYWEPYLKGTDGYDLKIVDAAGREIDNDDVAIFREHRDSEHGKNVVLTIDSRLQKVAEEKYAGRSGGLVALDPRTGEVLAIVSLPSYNPDHLASNVSHSIWAEIVSDTRNLLLNRAIQGTYPPGSTFKIITSIAALEEGVVKEDESIFCPGGMQYGGRFFKCWRKGGHGSTSIHRAIAESCDTFYYQLSLKLGVDKIAKYAKMFGMGKLTGLDLEGEKSGLVPTSEWKKRVFKEEWQPGENLSISVGQGYDTATPLQNALMVAQVAMGKKITPHLLKEIENDEGDVVFTHPNKESEPLPISQHTLDIVHAGMRDAIQSDGGTAHGIRTPDYEMAGKTGTAQVISEEGKSRARGINTGDHAWFVVYAPYKDPQIAIGVIVEHGGFGASAAAPIARAVLDEYIKIHKLLPEKVVMKGGE